MQNDYQVEIWGVWSNKLKLCYISHSMVSVRWVRNRAEKLDPSEMPSANDGTSITLLNEMWRFVNGKKQNLDLEGV